jgi:hypothetical protein
MRTQYGNKKQSRRSVHRLPNAGVRKKVSVNVVAKPEVKIGGSLDSGPIKMITPKEIRDRRESKFIKSVAKIIEK